ncbi:MAG: hypothetical protein ACOC33_02895 [bacterium]
MRRTRNKPCPGPLFPVMKDYEVTLLLEDGQITQWDAIAYDEDEAKNDALGDYNWENPYGYPLAVQALKAIELC